MNYRIEQLRFLLRGGPSSRGFYQLGELLRREGDHREAAEVLRAGLERHPRYVAAWVSLGRARFAAGDVTGAEDAFHRAMALDPDNAVAARMIAETAIAREDWPRAARALKLARELAPADLELDEKAAHVEARLLEVVGAAAGEAEPVPDADREPAASFDTAAIPVAAAAARGEPFEVARGGDTGMWRSMQEVFAAAEPVKAAEEPPPEPALEMSDEEVARAVNEGLPAEQEPTPEPEPALPAEPEIEPAAAPEAEPPPPPAGQELDPELVPTLEIDLGSRLEATPEVELDLDVEAEADLSMELDETTPGFELRASEPAVADEPEPEVVTDGSMELDETTPEPAVEPIVAEPPPRPEDAGRDRFAGLEEPFGSDRLPEEPEAEPDADDRMPLPTVTLARLALDQGDRELAIGILDSVLERDPEQADAMELLERLRTPPPPPPGVGFPSRRIAALQSWLDTVRLAAERRAAP